MGGAGTAGGEFTLIKVESFVMKRMPEKEGLLNNFSLIKGLNLKIPGYLAAGGIKGWLEAGYPVEKGK